jgi:hypothetical protein
LASVSDTIRKELHDLLDDQYQRIADLMVEGEVKSFIELGFSYQSWYTKALSIVSSLAPDRLEEFSGHYMNPKRKTLNALTYTINDYLQSISPVKDGMGQVPYNHHQIAQIRFLNQYQILAALASRIDSVLSDVKGHLFAELQDSELAAAGKLLNASRRAAGALAGVVLERHLQRTAINHGVKISKKEPTIADLNDPLKTAGVYDVPVWRKIQLLADLRNLCSHQKSREPTRDEVLELIQGVGSVIKSVF